MTTIGPPHITYGSPMPLLAEFKNAAGQLENPDTVRWRVRPPTGSEILITESGVVSSRLFTLANPATGKHTLYFVPWLAGQWWARVESFGAIQEAEEFEWYVPASSFGTASLTP